MFKILPPRVAVCGIKHALYVMSITSLGIECTLYSGTAVNSVMTTLDHYSCQGNVLLFKNDYG